MAGGVDCVQLREKDLPGAELYRLARELRTITSKAGVPLLINDRIDVALAVRAHGVHLGARSIPVAEARRLLDPGALIGYSAHSLEEAEGAVLGGADFIFFAPVFEPGSKSAGPAQVPQGLPALWRVAAVVPVPVYGLGGMTPERTAAALNPPAGAGSAPAGVAVVSAIGDAGDVSAAARRFVEALAGTAAARSSRAS